MDRAIEVAVQVCGRRESVVVPRLGAQELTTAVEERFSVHPPFFFADCRGRPLYDDAALAECAGLGEPLVVRLTEGVMHDISCRVGQLRHLQWGLLSKQLAVANQETTDTPPELVTWRQALERERLARTAGQNDLQRQIEAIHALLQQEQGSRTAALQAVEQRLAELQVQLGEQCSQHFHRVQQALATGHAEQARSLEELCRRLLEPQAREQQLAVRAASPTGMAKRVQHGTLVESLQQMEECRKAFAAERARRGELEEAVAGLRMQGHQWHSELESTRGQLAELREAYRSIKEDYKGALTELRGRVGTHGNGGLVEALSTLREEFREALQHEARLRADRDTELQEALAYFRQALETHTHEMHLPKAAGDRLHAASAASSARGVTDFQHGQAFTEGGSRRGSFHPPG